MNYQQHQQQPRYTSVAVTEDAIAQLQKQLNDLILDKSNLQRQVSQLQGQLADIQINNQQQNHNQFTYDYDANPYNYNPNDNDEREPTCINREDFHQVATGYPAPPLKEHRNLFGYRSPLNQSQPQQPKKCVANSSHKASYDAIEEVKEQPLPDRAYSTPYELIKGTYLEKMLTVHKNLDLTQDTSGPTETHDQSHISSSSNDSKDRNTPATITKSKKRSQSSHGATSDTRPMQPMFYKSVSTQAFMALMSSTLNCMVCRLRHTGYELVRCNRGHLCCQSCTEQTYLTQVRQVSTMQMKEFNDAAHIPYAERNYLCPFCLGPLADAFAIDKQRCAQVWGATVKPRHGKRVPIDYEALIVHPGSLQLRLVVEKQI